MEQRETEDEEMSFFKKPFDNLFWGVLTLLYGMGLFSCKVEETEPFAVVGLLVSLGLFIISNREKKP